MQGAEISGAANLRFTVTQPDAEEAVLTFDYTYNGAVGPTARALAIVDLRSNKGSSAWFGCDAATLSRGKGTISIKVRFFNDEEGVPESVTTDRVRLMFLNEAQTVVTTSAIFLKNIKWGKPGAKPIRPQMPAVGLKAPSPPTGESLAVLQKQQKETLAKEQQESERRKEALAKAEAETKRLAAEKLFAENKAKEDAELRQKNAAIEAQLREEAIKKAKAAAEQLVLEKAQAETKAKEEAAARERRAIIAAQIREENIKKAEAESTRLANEKAAAELMAKAEANARILAAAQEAKIKEEARLAAVAEAKQLAEMKQLAEEKAIKEAEARAAQAAVEAKQREAARLNAEAAIKKLAEEKALAEKLAKERAEEQAAAELKAQEEARIKAVAEAKRISEENARAELAAKQEREQRAQQAALEAKQREEARIKAEQQAQRLAQEKLAAETRAREEDEIRQKKLALEIKQREEARLAAVAESKRLAAEKLLAETQTREAEEASVRQIATENKLREEARLKVEAEAKRLSEAKIAADKKAEEEADERAKQEALQAKTREEALLKAQADAQRLAEEKAAADLRAVNLAKNQEKSEAIAANPIEASVSVTQSPATADGAPLTLSTSLQSKVTNLDVVNRSLDRSRMTFGVEYEYKDDFGPKAQVGVEVLRGSDPESRNHFSSTPLEIGKTRRNFLLFPVKFSPTHTLSDSGQYTSDKVLVYLRDPKTNQKQTMYPATMLLAWRAPGTVAVATQTAGAIEMEDFKQNDPTSGYVSLKYNLPANTPVTLKVRIYDSSKPESSAYFQPAEVLVRGGRGQQLIDIKVDPNNKSLTDYIKADTIEIEAIGPDKKTIEKITRKATMGWARPH